ncbi:hypothetical protein ACLMJK_003091 [Lecanora helva]
MPLPGGSNSIIKTWYPREEPKLYKDPDDAPIEITQLPLKELKAEYFDYANRWEASGHRGKVWNQMRSIRAKEPIKEVICIGLGNFGERRLLHKDKAAPGANKSSGSRTHHRINNTSLQQLIFLKTVLAELERHHNIGKVLFSDPAFSETEIKILSELDRRFRATTEPIPMSSGTFLYAPVVPVKVLHEYLQECFPVLYAGPPLDSSNKVEKDLVQRTNETKVAPNFLDGEGWEISYVFRWLK